tara:strand:- start:63 stop:509 length:447 start_codon:yes stop_codon:yes gene_type:complete
MKNILVATDLKEHSDFLINVAESYGHAFNARLWIIHIAAPDPDFVGYDVGPQYIRDIRAEDLREEHQALYSKTQQLKEKGLDAEGLLIQGSTVETLLGEAKKLNGDLVVIGKADHGFFYNLIYGDTTSNIVKESPIPVLIVPFPAVNQ